MVRFSHAKFKTNMIAGPFFQQTMTSKGSSSTNEPRYQKYIGHRDEGPGKSLTLSQMSVLEPT